MDKRTTRSKTNAVAAALLMWLVGFLGCSDVSKPGGTAPKLAATPRGQDAAAIEAPRADLTPEAAMKLLFEGNRRFMESRQSGKDLSASRRQSLAGGQAPLAAIVCCSDSRVPPELIFDQGLGDLFVVRVAGNVVDPVVLGSVEYAVEQLHVPLVVVLGHEECGAVKAAVAGGDFGGEIGAVVARIRPSVAAAAGMGQAGTSAVEVVTDLNVSAGERDIAASPIVSHKMAEQKVRIIGGKYNLTSGQVRWFWTDVQR